jgi:photosystem I subunit 10
LPGALRQALRHHWGHNAILKLILYKGENTLVTTLASSLLLTAAPRMANWSPTVAIIMILCNILAIAIGKLTISQPKAAPALPSDNLFGGFGLPALLGVTSFGHVLGAGVILGLSNMGVL